MPNLTAGETTPIGSIVTKTEPPPIQTPLSPDKRALTPLEQQVKKDQVQKLINKIQKI